VDQVKKQKKPRAGQNRLKEKKITGGRDEKNKQKHPRKIENPGGRVEPAHKEYEGKSHDNTHQVQGEETPEIVDTSRVRNETKKPQLERTRGEPILNQEQRNHRR